MCHKVVGEKNDEHDVTDVISIRKKNLATCEFDESK